MSIITRPKLCFVSATPLTIHFFMKPHIVALAQHFDVTLVCNPHNDAYVPQGGIINR